MPCPLILPALQNVAEAEQRATAKHQARVQKAVKAAEVAATKQEAHQQQGEGVGARGQR